jgi:sulfatase modifying factor 1
MQLRCFFLLLIMHISCCAAIAQQKPKGMVKVPEGIFQDTLVTAFYMDKTPVTVQQYRQFITKTGYKTEAEHLGSASVYDFKQQEWVLRESAYWEYPLGKMYPKAEAKHPVTQVSWKDVQAYCEWAGKRLPSILEWEYAARNAQSNTLIYPWGNDLVVNDKYKANCWQGIFPSMNLMEDGFRFTSPVGYYGRSDLGLSDLAGNVWEWTKDEVQVDGLTEKVQKGGSFMCEKTVCHGYQITGQTSASAESSLFHVGFRCVRTID